MWMQHVLVIAFALMCFTVIARMAFKTLRGRGKLGACCAKGCEASAMPQTRQRAVFMPVEMLTASKGRRR